MTLYHRGPTWCTAPSPSQGKAEHEEQHVSVDKDVPLASPCIPTSCMIPPENLYALPWRLKTLLVFYCRCNNLLPI